MARKGAARKRQVQPDPKFHDLVVARFINTMMYDGKRSVAESSFYTAIDLCKEKTGEDGLKIFKKALENVKPMLEVKSRRVGGATYQVPIEVKPSRRQSLACRWMVIACRTRPEHTFAEKLANEFVEATKGQGGAMKKRDEVHRMAEANKAFSHFRW